MLSRQTILRFATTLFSLGLLFVTLEIGLRAVSVYDEDGNLHVAGLWLRPFRPPLAAIAAHVERMQTGESLYIRYDADLGWTVGPNVRSEDGMYVSNAQGIRTGDEQAATPAAPTPGTVRIALYGDSFTHSSDVVFEDSWGHMLEERLAELGMQAEVLNQGTPGYAIDQAYLRWRKEGRPFAPDIVVFGFQSSDMKRNLNLLRVLYSPSTGLHFSKPRFVLDGEGLRLVNVPTLRPERIADVLVNFEQWELAPHEFYYQPENYEDRALYNSRLACFLSTGVGTLFSQRRPYESFFSEGSQSREITRRIIERFEREARAAGSRFVIVHIPTWKRLRRLSWGLDLDYRDLLDALMARYDVADPTDELMDALAKRDMGQMRAGGGHYSRIANREIADVLADTLLAEDRR